MRLSILIFWSTMTRKRIQWKKGIHEPVRRPTRIRVSYLDEDFQPHDEWVEGYLARVMQHEFDHLDGKMFVDHLSMLRKQMVKGKLGNLLKGNFRCAYKVKTKK